MSELIDLTGQRFGRLVVVERAGNYITPSTGKPSKRYLCKCECGTKKVVQKSHLLSGSTKSCGCLQKEKAAQRATHGKTGTSEHNTWLGMRQRCSYPKHASYKNYGGRGITVCDRWLNSFENFLEDMGEKPTPDHSIDRMDANGNYDPDNCQWENKKTQASNTRKNRYIKYKNTSKTITEWGRVTGIDRRTISDRLKRNWTIERALTTPCRNSPKL